jgi:hypothetical protein
MSKPSFPVFRPPVTVRDGQHLDGYFFFAIDNRKWKAIQHELASCVLTNRPPRGRLGN